MPIKFNKTTNAVTCETLNENDSGFTNKILPFDSSGTIQVKELIETDNAYTIDFKRSTSTFTCKEIKEE